MILESFLTNYRQRINDYLHTQLKSTACAETTLNQAVLYSTLSGGKRLRPLLVYAVAIVLQPEKITTYLPNIDRCAAACELLHCYSLVHDDLPVMDNDDWRRGKLTCHKQFSEANAILVGDGLQALAFSLLSEPMAHIDHLQQLQMITLLANAVGLNGMVGGQAIDLANQATTLPQVVNMHRLKTGALFRAAVGLGARSVGCCDHTMLTQLDQFADQLGLAYQIQDDILEATQSSAQLGKSPQSDLVNDKSTFIRVLGIEAASDYLQTTYQQATDSLQQLGLSDSLLAKLLVYITQREG